MAYLGATRLDSGDIFPPLTLHTTDGSTRALPDRTQPGLTVLLIYRGYW